MSNESLESKSGSGVPIPLITAVWAGMSREDISAGLAAGTIVAAGQIPEGGLANSAIGVRGGLAADVQAPAEQAGAVATDRARVESWFRTLDPQLDGTTFESIWNRAGNDDPTRASILTACLSRALLGVPAGPERTVDTSAAQSASVAASLDAFLADPTHRALVVDLSAKSGAEIARMAQTDIGYRYALTELQPFALTGNRALLAGANADGHLHRFDPDSGEPLISDAWLGDRAKFLAWKLADDAGMETAIAGTEDWTLIDRGSVDAAGNPVSIELKSGAPGAGSNQVVFGNDDAEYIKGGTGTDRIYGGRGDDVLRGGAGSDHLEGGAGDDVVLGGSGSDELLGDQGDDELEGGAGNDRLGGGSGADILTGGRGDDRLEGGTGYDTYVFDSGDGNDTIIDADGSGVIEIDGMRAEGTMLPGEEGWHSSDGRLEFAFSGDAQEGGTLTVTALSAGNDRFGAPANTISVKNWKNGDFGITLSGNVAAGDAMGATTSHLSGDLAEVSSSGIADASTAASADSGGSDAATGIGEDVSDAAGNGQGLGADDASDPAADGVAGEAGNSDESDADADGDSGESGESGTGTGNGAGTKLFDFDNALSSLLGTNDAAFTTLDPERMQHAIDAFSGVLEPPDVSPAMIAHSTHGAEGVTAAHLADALAGDVTADAFEAELGMTVAPSMAPDLRMIDAGTCALDRYASQAQTTGSGQLR